MFGWNAVINELYGKEAQEVVKTPVKRDTMTVDQLIKELKMLRKLEGGDAKVYVCNGKDDVDVVNLIIDHNAIIING